MFVVVMPMYTVQITERHYLLLFGILSTGLFIKVQVYVITDLLVECHLVTW